MRFIAVVENKQEINAIAEQLQALGCKVELVLKRTGVISGDTGRKKISSLLLPGIKSMEPERKVAAKKSGQ